MTTLAENVTEILSRAKRQSEVSEAIGVDQSTISRIAKGSQPKPENLIALARYVGVSVETLVQTPIDEWEKVDRAAFKRSRERRGWSTSALTQEAAAIIKRERGSAKITVGAVEDFERGNGDDRPSWLMYAEMAFQEGAAPKQLNTEAREELVYIRQFDIRYAMGAGTTVDDFPDTKLVPFNLDFVKALTPSSTERLFLAEGFGDSMEPIIHKHDMVLIDTSETRLDTGDTIWALEYAESGYIKRLRSVRRDGARKIVILSANPDYPPETADPSEVRIIGKVIWIARKM